MAQILGTPGNDEVWDTLRKNIGMVGGAYMQKGERERTAVAEQEQAKKKQQDQMKLLILQSLLKGEGQFGGEGGGMQMQQILGGGMPDMAGYQATPAMAIQPPKMTAEDFALLQSMTENQSIEDLIRATPAGQEPSAEAAQLRAENLIRPHRKRFGQQFLPQRQNILGR